MPGKNIRLMHGKPLFAYTAEAGLAAKRLDRVVLSTDDRDIAEEGKRLGLEVPFLRPAKIARDSTPTLPVVLHALKALEEAGEHFDAVCLLQPTNPLRRASDIDGCVELLETSDADCVLSVLPVPAEHHPDWVYRMNRDGSISLNSGESEPITRRQDLAEVFHRDGSVYVTKCDVVIGQKSLYGRVVRPYLMAAEFSANIDTAEDWQMVEARLAKRSQD